VGKCINDNINGWSKSRLQYLTFIFKRENSLLFLFLYLMKNGILLIFVLMVCDICLIFILLKNGYIDIIF